MATPQYVATLNAVSRLDGAIKMLLNSDPPEPRSPKWTPELIRRLVEGMQACRWFLATGFDPQEQFGSWLRRRLEENELGPPDGPHGDFYGSWAWHAADAVDQLRREWRPEWSKGSNDTNVD